MVKTIKYMKGAIYHAIYIKLLSDGTVSYLAVSNDDVLHTNNNETTFPKLRRVFEEAFEINPKKELSLGT